jgi:hypothetical protein
MKSRFCAWILAALLPAVTGCLWTPELSEIQREIERQLPGARFEKDVRINLGPLSLGLARFATGFIPADMAPEAHEAHDYLQEVRRVQVALYRTLELPPLHKVRLPQHLEDRIRDEGWHLAVKKQQPTELVWVLTQEEKGLVRDIYVILLNTDNLALVRVQGRMDQLLAKAMENRAGELPQMLGLDLSLQQ